MKLSMEDEDLRHCAHWRQAAMGSEDDVKDAILTGFKAHRRFASHNYHLIPGHHHDLRILDFGCGIGRNFNSLRRFAGTLSAYDLPEMIEACRKYARTEGVCLLDDWLQVERARYDVTVATLVLQHLLPNGLLPVALRQISQVSAYLYVSGRCWCDGPGSKNLLEAILDTGHFEFVAGDSSEADYRAVSFPDEASMEVVLRSLEFPERDDRSDALFDRMSGSEYSEWVRRYDTPRDNPAPAFGLPSSRHARQPLISVLMPTFNSDPDLLSEAIESVLKQTYDVWELCVVDDASDEEHVRDALEEFSKRDPRIKFEIRSSRGHIAAATNDALRMARGEFIALLDHDDLLPADALHQVARYVSKHPDANILYSDEDKIDLDGKRFDPYFKPDWNPDLLLSHNMISHLGVYRTSVVREIAGFTIGLEGSQDYDLALRVSEVSDVAQIIHIPHVLYHWRAAPGTTALSLETKPYASEAAKKAIAGHLERTRKNADVLDAPDCWGSYRVKYRHAGPRPLVTIVIPTRNQVELLRTCISSIVEKTAYKNYEIQVSDNGSDDRETRAYLESCVESGVITLIDTPGEFNYARIMNESVRRAWGDLIVMLNNDTEVIDRDWLDELATQAMRPEIGVVGAKLLYPDDTVQHVGVILGMYGGAGHHSRRFGRDDNGFFGRLKLLQNYSAVTGACMAVRKALFIEAGGMDDRHFPISLNDIDLCLKIRRLGFRVLWTPYATLYHHESKSRGHDDTPCKQHRALRELSVFQERWPEEIANDPAFNPNLALDSEHICYAFPPRVNRHDY